MTQFTLEPDVASIINDLRKRVSTLESMVSPAMLTWRKCSLTAGYTSDGNTALQVGKDPSGQIHLRGGVITPASPVSGTTIATLPDSKVYPTQANLALYPCTIWGTGTGAYWPASFTVSNAGAIKVSWGTGPAGEVLELILGEVMYR